MTKKTNIIFPKPGSLIQFKSKFFIQSDKDHAFYPVYKDDVLLCLKTEKIELTLGKTIERYKVSFLFMEMSCSQTFTKNEFEERFIFIVKNDAR